ncbi:ABC transporter, putative [Trypanosoma cruzi marinkellei]|uniref:ABC transporter, putative n=1 Tax=Trypanosoma cruzi marinkellei TaxID=85056 RepID=K2N6P7_TRYCR|nr:ABC transporter, putative [Trypanosoma cruzi marinkellei]
MEQWDVEELSMYSDLSNSASFASFSDETNPTWMKSRFAEDIEAPSFWTQLLAAVHRETTERRRTWKEVLIEICVPLMCVACTTFLWNYFGDEYGPEASYVNYSYPLPNTGAIRHSSFFCYNDSLINSDGSRNFIPGLLSCSQAPFIADCSGEEDQLPVKGLCTDMKKKPVLVFAGYAMAFLNEIPKLDDLFLLHWAASKQKLSMGNGEAYRDAGIFLINTFSSLCMTGSLFIGPAANVPPLLVKYFQSASIYFDLVYAGTFDDITELQERIARGDVFAVININAMTVDKFDVEIRMDEKSVPPPGTVISPVYSGGIHGQSGEIYIVSGFLTLQKMLYDFYLKEVKHIPFNKRHFTPYVISMGSVAHSAPKLIRESGMLVAFAIVLSLMYPVTLLARRRVVEKELRIREIMEIMGLRKCTMDLSWFLLAVATMLLISALSVAIMRPYIRRTEYLVYFLIFFVHALTMVPFAGFISAFFNNSRFASMMVPLIYFATSSLPLGIQVAGAVTKAVFCVIPQTSFFFSLILLFQHELAGGLSLSDAWTALDKPNLALVLVIVTGDFFLYLLLMIYLEAVMPREYGTPKHPLFFILEPCKRFLGHAHEWDEGGPDGRDPNGTYEEMDGSVDYAVEIKGLRREYKRGRRNFLAVDNLYWNMPNYCVSVLLGPNGAGKSTTINMITGMTRPDAGDCRVFGRSVRNELSVVRQNISLCPQHNVLWSQLTCREHLEFFGRIKGLKGLRLKEAVMRMLHEVDLYDKMDCNAHTLSGGQKRKLSLAAAFVGGSRLVLLDEPTAGMDAVARRHMWGLLRRMSFMHAILLTTHFMDEADILGDHVAIMSRGVLKCCGSSLFLKSRLAAAYTLQISLTPDANYTAINSLIASYIPKAYTIFSGLTELKCRIPAGNTTNLVPLLKCLESPSQYFGIRDYALSAMTLEDVFLSVVAEAEASSSLENLPVDVIWNCSRVWGSSEGIGMQFRALLKKRILCAVRDWRALSFQIIFPAACVLLAMVLDSVSHNQPTSVELTPSVYPFDTMSDAVGCSAYFTASTYAVPGSTHQVHITDRNMLNSMNLSWYHVDNYLRHPLAHLSSFSCADPNYAATLETNPIMIFYNTSAPHEVATALSTLYSLILQSVVGAGEILRTNMRYLSDAKLVTVDNAFQIVFKGFVVVVPFTILPSNCVSWVVHERECGARHLQYLSGLRFFVYWGVNFLFDMAAYLLTFVLVIIIFLVFEQKAFVGSDTIGPTTLLLLTYGFTGTSMAYVLYLFFKSHVNAQSTVMVICFAVGFFPLVVVNIFTLVDKTQALSEGLRWPFRLMPTYAVGEGIINLITLEQHRSRNPTLNVWSMSTVGWACLFMACEFPVFMLITLIVDHPRFQLKMRKLSYHPHKIRVRYFDDDSDVEDERIHVHKQLNRREVWQDDVTLFHLRKMYSNGKLAVKDITFGLVRGEVFAFLGTNGAGKTTAISILCQQSVPTSGRAYICGYDVVEDGDKARACIGYCPQFDACLDLLTVEEHLQLYASIQGILKQHHTQVVESLMRLCGVEEYRETRAHQLSGGNRRKLSLALALMGGPKVVLLDEPTTGMDPIARRAVWKSIHKIAEKCSVLLTTHHLDEVEALAGCVAIMVDGDLRCIGNKTHLKNKFGTGAEMSLRIRDKSCRKKVKRLVEAFFPDAVLNEYNNQRFVYSLPKRIPLYSVFEVLQNNADQVGITDYGVSQTSIEQVFMRISEAAKAKL